MTQKELQKLNDLISPLILKGATIKSYLYSTFQGTLVWISAKKVAQNRKYKGKSNPTGI